MEKMGSKEFLYEFRSKLWSELWNYFDFWHSDMMKKIQSEYTAEYDTTDYYFRRGLTFGEMGNPIVAETCLCKVTEF